jgi:hypothetical protein
MTGGGSRFTLRHSRPRQQATGKGGREASNKCPASNSHAFASGFGSIC